MAVSERRAERRVGGLSVPGWRRRRRWRRSSAPSTSLLSNILRNVNVTLLPAIHDALAPGGVAIFSGMEEAEAPLFRPVLAPAGFAVVDEVLDAGWWAVAARRVTVNVLVPVGSLVTGARIVLDALEVHHLRVRRAGAGEAIRLLDGAGGVGEGTLELGRKDAVVTVGAVHREDAAGARWCSPSGPGSAIASRGWWRRPRSSA